MQKKTHNEIAAGLRCVRCLILVFLNADDATSRGVVFSNEINLSVRKDEKLLCVGCATGK